LTPSADLSSTSSSAHLFEEPDTLGKVAELAGQWFERYLQRAAAHVRS